MENNHSNKTIFNARYGRLIAKLVELRKSKGLTQRQLAEKGGYDNCFVGRVEIRERRLDVLELIDYCRALDIPDADIMQLVQSVLNDKSST